MILLLINILIVIAFASIGCVFVRLCQDGIVQSKIRKIWERYGLS